MTTDVIRGNGADRLEKVLRSPAVTRRQRPSPVTSCILRVALTLLGALCVAFWIFAGSRPRTTGDLGAERVFMVIAVGSAPGHLEQRQMHRLNYDDYKNSPGSERVVTAFFTEPTEETVEEQRRYGDVVFNPGEGGYQDFAARGRQHLAWALETYDFDYYLRLDDDGVLCLDRLVHQLKAVNSAPETSMLFWGKYWCERGRSRADENFMLFSRSLAVYMHNLLAHVKLSGSTFALDVGAYLIQMKDVIIIDDRGQIDSQQGYVTPYMRKPFDDKLMGDYQRFCKAHIWAHHVQSVDVMRAAIEGRMMMKEEGEAGGSFGYLDPVPTFLPPNETCGARYSYNLNSFFAM